MYVYERIPDLLTTNLENISQRRMTLEIRYIERKKVRFLWLSERSERNHSILWAKSTPSHYLIRRYYIDTRV